MAIILSDNIQTNAPKPSDSRYLNNLVPYTGVSEVNLVIDSGNRYTGLTVNVVGTEYWFKDGISDNDLVIKTATGFTTTTEFSGYTGVTAPATYLPFTMTTDMQDPTGFVDGSSINVAYNHANRTVTLTGTLDYYWRGVKKTLTSPWTSGVHTATVGVWFLSSIDGTNFTWSQTPWNFTDIQVVEVSYRATEAATFGVRETHGLMDWNTHSTLHRTIGTSLRSGGQVTVGSYTVNTATDSAVSPSFETAIVTDEDLTSTISAWNKSNGYTTMYVSGLTSVYNITATHPFIAVGANQFIQINNPITGTMTAGGHNNYYNIYQILIPVTSDAASQKYRMVFLQPQVAFTSLSAAQTEDTRGLYLGDLTSASEEYIIYSRLTYYALNANTNYGKVTIPTNGISYVYGTKMSALSVGGVSATNHPNLSNLTWVNSGHLGANDSFAAFDSNGNACNTLRSSIGAITGSTISATSCFIGSGAGLTGTASGLSVSSATTANNSTCLNGQLASYYSIATHAHGNINNGGCVGTATGCIVTTSTNGCVTTTAPSSITVGTATNATSATTANNSTCLNGQLGSYYAIATHAHGNINNGGCIGSTTGLVITTTTNGCLTALAAGSAGQYLAYNGTWQTPDGGGGINMSGTTVNGLTTHVNSNTICTQPNLTFNGSRLDVTGCLKVSTRMIAGGLTNEHANALYQGKIDTGINYGNFLNFKDESDTIGFSISNGALGNAFFPIFAGKVTSTNPALYFLGNSVSGTSTGTGIVTFEGRINNASTSDSETILVNFTSGYGSSRAKLMADGTFIANVAVCSPAIVGTSSITGYNGGDLRLVAAAGSNDTGDIVFYSGNSLTCEWARIWSSTNGCLYYRSACDGLAQRTVYHSGNISGATAGNATCLNGQAASYYSIATHTHGNINNGGCVGTATGCIVTTTTNGCITVTSPTSMTVNNSTCLNGQAATFYMQNVCNNALQSLRDFVNGTLIETCIDYSVTNGSPFMLELRGNTYGQICPVDTIVQGYIYNDTIINCGGIQNGFPFSCVVAVNYNNHLTFWIPRQQYWHGYTVYASNVAGVSRKSNSVISITDSALPTTSKCVCFPMVNNVSSANIASQSVTYATTAGSAPANGGTANNSTCLNGQLASFYQTASNAITTSNIGSQSVCFATNAGKSSCVGIYDTRSINFDGFTYQGISQHLKTNTTDGLSDGGTYHGITHITHWTDVSGGKAHQLGFTDNNNVWHRTYDTSWGTWTKFAKFSDAANSVFDIPSVNAGSGYKSSGNLGGTGTAARFPTGIYSDGSNWLYGTVITNGALCNNSGNYCIGAAGAASFASLWSSTLTSSGALSLCAGSVNSINLMTGTAYVLRGFATTCAALYFNNVETFKTVSNGICLNTYCGFAVDWIATSDCRLKENITPISNALSIVTQLCGVCYNLCSDSSHENRIGLIAQDVDKVLPEIVSHSDASDEDKKYGITDDKLGLKYDKLTAVLIEAIKELSIKNESLQIQINELKNK